MPASNPDHPSVLFAVWQSGSLANGGVTSATEILRGLSGRRVVLTQRESTFTDRWREMGCDVHVWPLPQARPIRGLELLLSRAARVPDLALRNLRLAKLVRDNDIRVVHCNDIAAFWFTAPGARLAGARVVFNVRDMFPPEAPYGPRWKAIHAIADEIVCLSNGMRTEVLDRMALPAALEPHLSRARVEYIYSVVDLERMRPATAEHKVALRKRLRLPESGFVVAYVGTFCEKKNQLGFIEEVLPKLTSRIPEAHVAFAGDFEPTTDDYARRCKARVEELGLADRVTFAGFTRDPSEFYRAADVTALTSRYEGLPRCMIESLACGVPVVSFDVTSVREFLEDRGAGIAIGWGDYDALTNGLVSLAHDPARTRALGAVAREVAEECFARARAIEAYTSVYERLAAESAR